MYNRERAIAYKKAQEEELHATLKEIVKSYQMAPETIVELLEFKDKFYNYSPRNAMLIRNQNPYATYVASYRKWNELGYSVKKGEHGLKLFVPVQTTYFKTAQNTLKTISEATEEEKAQIAAGEIKTQSRKFFHVGTVFDISQTTCPPEDYPKLYHMGYPSGEHGKLYNAVRQYAAKHGLTVTEQDVSSISLRGYYSHDTKTIVISDKLEDTHKLDTLTHELGHAVMYDYYGETVSEVPTVVKELEADAVSIMLETHVGLPITDSRRHHFATVYEQCRQIPDFNFESAMNNVSAAYHALRRDLDPVLEQAIEKSAGLQPSTSTVNNQIIVPDLVKETVPQQTEVLNSNGTREAETKDQQIASVVNSPDYQPESNLNWPELHVTAALMDTACDVLGKVGSSLVAHDPVRQTYVPAKGVKSSQIIEQYAKIETIKQTGDPVPPKQLDRRAPADRDTYQRTRRGQSPTPSYQLTKDQLEQLKHDVSILRVAEDMGYHLKRVGSYLTTEEHDSLRFYPETNSFSRFSTGEGGSVIDFVSQFGEMPVKEAILTLKERYWRGAENPAFPIPPREAPKPPEKKPFILPEQTEGQFRRAMAYLTKTRCLDPQVVRECMQAGLLYEDERHNVVFVGKDLEGTPQFATRHGTLTEHSFKGDVAGSDQTLGFRVEHPGAGRVYVTEAPIDALSVLTMDRDRGYDTGNASYLATCGTGKTKVVERFLQEHPELREVVLANDNDPAGQEANRKLKELIREGHPELAVKELVPIGANDMNEMLQNHRNPARERQAVQDPEPAVEYEMEQ